MRFLDTEMFENVAGIFGGAQLAVSVRRFGDVGRRIAARVIDDAAVGFLEKRDLIVPGAVIVGELMDK